AFPEEGDSRSETVDVYGIIRGARYDIKVVLLAQKGVADFLAVVPVSREPRMVLGVAQRDEGSFCYDVVEFPDDMLKAHGRSRGGYYEVEVRHVPGRGYVSGKDAVWPQITTFAERI